ncbi:MAG TPA: hypothetical protein VFX49_09450 [Chloroflexota bacterium]|nr:hypothetical protein [Chloroflexota bacterium]
MGFFANQHRPRFHLTLQEASARFGVSPNFLLWGIRLGKLRSKRAVHRSWVTPTAVSMFIERERDHPHAPWNTVLHAQAS